MKYSYIKNSVRQFIALLLFLGFAPIAVFGQTTSPIIVTVPGAYNLTIPCGVTSITVECWGGGGGGGAGTGNPAGGGGGAGGNYVRSTFAVLPGQVIPLTVGTGGTAGVAGAGGAGGNTFFNTALIMQATGGLGGSGAAAGGTSGAGGASSIVGCVGTTIRAGGAGGTGATGISAGGGGEGAGQSVAGNNGGVTVGGTGTAGADGGAGGITTGNGGIGTAGVQPGGGGGGGRAGNNTDRAGGAGGAGQIIIVFTPVSAGSDQNLAGCVTTATLGATAPVAGIGTWTCIAGCAGVVITSPNSPTSGVTGLVPGTATTFRWTVSNAGCSSTFDNVLITANFGAGCNTFIHGAAGINNENVGNCLVNTCSGTYVDPGGAAGNYPNSVGGPIVYRVFCPPNVGQCTRLTFNSFALEGPVDPAGPPLLDCYFDYMTIADGATQNSPRIMTSPPVANPANGTGRICGTPATPFTFTANNPSGCLSVAFSSDVSGTLAGWSATLSCVPCPTASNGPNGTDNNDCVRATPLCSGSTVATNASGPGLVAEGCTGSACPAGGENHSKWYSFTIQSGGTLTMNINPQVATDDYDFSIYGPNATCGALGAPLRCTDSGTTGATGMNTTALDLVEDVLGDKFLTQMNVTAGQTYLMVIDEWTPNTGLGFDLIFGGTASLDCIVLLPVQLTKFEPIYDDQKKQVDVNWEIARETNIDYYDVEKSYDGVNFDFLEKVLVYGNSNQPKTYSVKDLNPVFDGVTYYRLKYGETNGSSTYSDVGAVEIFDPVANNLILKPNPVDDNLNIRFYAGGTGYCMMQIIDVSGHTVVEYRIGTAEGMNIADIDLSNLASGFYVFNLVVGNTNYYRKIVKK